MCTHIYMYMCTYIYMYIFLYISLYARNRLENKVGSRNQGKEQKLKILFDVRQIESRLLHFFTRNCGSTRKFAFFLDIRTNHRVLTHMRAISALKQLQSSQLSNVDGFNDCNHLHV